MFPLRLIYRDECGDQHEVELAAGLVDAERQRIAARVRELGCICDWMPSPPRDRHHLNCCPLAIADMIERGEEPRKELEA